VLDRTRDRDVQRSPVALGPLVAEALSLVSTRLASRNLTADSALSPDLPPVPGDRTALRQVVVNLLTNAIDASEPGGRITIGGTVLASNGAPGSLLELTVQDGGSGMTPEEQRRAFEPFYTTKAPGRGTGLGLVIVDHVVRAHGGRVVVESERGRGTAMRVWLPLEA